MEKHLLLAALIISLLFCACGAGSGSEPKPEPEPGEETYAIAFDANGGEGGQAVAVMAAVGRPMPALTAGAPSKGFASQPA